MNKANRVSASEAGIDKQSISKNALNVVETIQQAGFQAYLVGGCARDLLLGLKPKDFDVSTDATPEQTQALFKKSRIIGRRFKIVHVRFGYEVIEVATFRANAGDREDVKSHEMTEGDQGQLLRDNVYGTIEEDVVRRDFTANALYYDPFKDEVVDFLGGIEDIRAGKLISIGEPEQRFREDPVRMLRVVRFAAKLGFSMEPEALQMIEQEGKLLSHVSSARLFEEVLKLFHGGAAYDTYQMLRKYGLFKYLFPFTDQYVIDDVQGMPELALQNTDKRVKQGKPVIPAFLFACMMWDPIRADAQVLMSDGAPESQAWRVAMNDGLRDQNQYVAVPRRLAEIILDIWNIHFRLIKSNPRMVKASLNNRRFRAAYDFLLLRTSLHEVDEEIGEWWTRIQEVEGEEREAMISELGEDYKNRKNNRHGDGEANGNSVNYNERQPNNNRSGQGKGGQQSRSGGTQARGGRGKPTGRRHTSNGRGGGRKPYAGNDSNYSRGGGQNNWGDQRQGGRARSPSSNNNGTYQVGDQEINQKKVKVRRKRRVVAPEDRGDSDNTTV